MSDEVAYAYDVLETFANAMRKVRDQPGYFLKFLYEYLEKIDVLMDAVEVVTKEEHLGIVGEVMKASVEMIGSCLKVVVMLEK